MNLREFAVLGCALLFLTTASASRQLKFGDMVMEECGYMIEAIPWESCDCVLFDEEDEEINCDHDEFYDLQDTGVITAAEESQCLSTCPGTAELFNCYLDLMNAYWCDGYERRLNSKVPPVLQEVFKQKGSKFFMNLNNLRE
mmetsp:Transcript_16158/g.21389  ORF Transcript_16158/g.21389 Transcript_16158/m.21389 type:complete len:142 (+) Transcript_16158:246-671(+)|eukprot:CAMPEP_0117759290 /NCGR_PEP_ID=MMETSP0947-20121206/15928_1 /TAXON_ID=44440 /ORGANISM="Chattonella subsalsa, Strain CCMP2191" /LENGTH=141 /DNA_ID=CAMNT_0005579725 /DNA_START=173 /DNA_END=598 /DNA_ORIENTATION=+